MPVHAPYHFVPLSQWVHQPEWAGEVSHDHPFKHGYSGRIDYTLTNGTPLCVGGDQETQPNQPSIVRWCRTPQGEPVIPGTGIKGLLRSVVEIAGFGKFSTLNDRAFAYRDISNSDTPYAKRLQETHCQAGWIKFNPDEKRWQFRSCQHTVLFSDEFRRDYSVEFKNTSAADTALSKYQKWPLSRPPIKFDLQERTLPGCQGHNVTVERADNLGKGRKQGFLVFSGFRPGPQACVNTRLNYNYLFYAADSAPISLSAQEDQKWQAQIQHLFANHDADLVDYLRKNPHPELGIPVFARFKGSGKSKTLEALGFAKMPRARYKNSTHDIARKNQKAAFDLYTFDLPELIFGTLRDKGFGLKSRTSFSDARAPAGTAKRLRVLEEAVVLGEPRASYLNAYLEQPTAQNNGSARQLESYDNGNARLSGWKRYPVHSPGALPPPPNDNKAVQSRLEILPEQQHFSGSIVFHNLKAEELGALLWALRLGTPASEKSPFFHSLGHGKPLGFGAVQFQVKLAHLRPNHKEAKLSEPDQFMAQFVQHMEQHYANTTGKSWKHSPPLRHLLAFADFSSNQGRDLSYMPLQSQHGETSYVSSMQRNKLPLPAWTYQGGQLARQEEKEKPIAEADGVTSQRLLDLLSTLASTESQSVTYQQKLEALKAAIQQREAEEVRTARLKTLSDFGKCVLKLEEHLKNPEKNHRGLNPTNKIEKLIDTANTGYPEIPREEVAWFVSLVEDTTICGFLAINNKKKLKPRKAAIHQLKEKYGLLESQE